MKLKIKNIISAVAILLLLASTGLLVSCQKDGSVEGLLFVSNGDGTCYVSDLGLWKQDELVVPETSPEGDKVTAIGNYAFRGAEVKKIVLPDTVTKVGLAAFNQCRQLETVVLPDSIIHIGYDAFYDCHSLAEVRIPSGITELSPDLFYGCQALKRVTIPEGLTKIGELAFYGCTSLTHVTVEGSGTETVAGVILPEGLTTLGKSAFYGCRSLENAVIPKTLSEFGVDAFYGCNGLKGVYVTDLSAWCAARFFNAASNPLYNASTMYVNGESSACLVIPEGVAAIGNYAFSHGKFFSSLSLPLSLRSIGIGAFHGCDSLTDVYFAGTQDAVGKIDTGSSNDPLRNAELHYENEDETVGTEGAE